jgi:hypothetical protein
MPIDGFLNYGIPWFIDFMFELLNNAGLKLLKPAFFNALVYLLFLFF